MARESLGEFEQLVLLAILRLGDQAYGVPIVEEIELRTGRTVSRPAVYIALRRLGKKELVTSTLAAPTPEPGGRAKRYYRVQKAGLDMLTDSRRDLLSMWDGLSPVFDNR
jgi:DNA-binding PadR family transcriptional regulator